MVSVTSGGGASAPNTRKRSRGGGPVAAGEGAAVASAPPPPAEDEVDLSVGGGSEATSDSQSVRSETTSRSATPTAAITGGGGGRGGGGRKRGRGGRRKWGSSAGGGGASSSKQTKAAYRCTGFWREDHGQPIFGVAVNLHLGSDDDGDDEEAPVVFATVGNNRVTLYEALPGGDCRLLQCYADPDADENFYTCAWSFDPEDGRPVLAAAGSRGIVRVFSPANMSCVKHYVGHGQCINELKFHPSK